MQPLDPQKVAQAIRQAESGGNYNAVGDVGLSSGASHGAYQFQPATWKNYAQQILGDSNAPLTPENQDKVATTKFTDWIKQGKTLNQIASMWNAGEGSPDAYLNTHQKHGNTPVYAHKVSDAYNKLSGGNQLLGSEQVTPDAQKITYNTTPQKQMKPQLTHSQLIENINAMEKQGAQPQEIQGYLDSLKGGSNSQFNGDIGGLTQENTIVDNTPPPSPEQLKTQGARQEDIKQGNPVSVNPNKDKPSIPGQIIRAPLKLLARGATNLYDAFSGTTDQPFSGSYLGKVTGIGSGESGNDYGFSAKNLGDAVGSGIEASGYIEGGRALGGLLGKLLVREGLEGSAPAVKTAIEGYIVKSRPVPKGMALDEYLNTIPKLTDAEKYDALSEAFQTAKASEKTVLQQAMDRLKPLVDKAAGADVPWSKLNPNTAAILNKGKGLIGGLLKAAVPVGGAFEIGRYLGSKK